MLVSTQSLHDAMTLESCCAAHVADRKIPWNTWRIIFCKTTQSGTKMLLPIRQRTMTAMQAVEQETRSEEESVPVTMPEGDQCVIH